ncbi:magnesium and cobalt transport protein CorA (plasmid) [Rhizobium leguminosarum]|uniref:magnesium and cobalt transport protein CorA n=1 Tax=Rhizobium leguminosarum TaxID=384 RepID=UPI0024A83884|nr:magnesium and cobalt transport protein CorA [Rhizobium leguminosarum]MDI5925195.1 magnesium and cobalt transport protein CorA [Rhizobium leguminosarum]
MSIVAAYLYRDGKRVGAVSLGDPQPLEATGEFAWIGLHDPTKEEMAALQKAFRLHPLAVEDALDMKQVPKVEVYDDQIFVMAKTAHLDGDEIEYGETAIFVGPRHIVSVRHGSDRGHSELRRQLEEAPQILKNGPDYVLHGILDFVVDGYLPVVQTIEDHVLAMERDMLDSILGRAEIKRLFKLRRQLIRFQRVLGPMTEVCGKLVHLDLPCVDVEAKNYFRDVLDHARRVEGTVAGLKDVITSVFEASNLLEQQRQGTITRQLAAWAAIAAVPTAIAGIYGMNFEDMPELKTEYGYYVVIAVIASMCGLLYFRFKRSGWL